MWKRSPVFLVMLLCACASVRPDAALRNGLLDELATTGEWTALATEAEAAGRRLARSGFRDPEPFARVEAYRALAHYELGRDTWRWHWESALNFSSASAVEVILPYGAAAAFSEVGRAELTVLSIDEGVTPARATNMVRPNRYLSATRGRVPVGVELQYTVSVEGVPTRPRFVGPAAGEADVYYSLMESVREWRFVPAERDGVPVEFPTKVVFNLGIVPDIPEGVEVRRLR